MEKELHWIGKQIGNYKLTEVLSKSIRSCLYLAYDETQPQRAVVLKCLKSWLDEDSSKLFHVEARYLLNVRHPSILPILERGIEEGYPYVVAEYAPNGSLRDKLERQRGQLLPEREVERILSQIVEGLRAGWPVVHRDLKPEKILFNAQGDVQIAYFYLSYFYFRRISPSISRSLFHVFSSLPYAAPEWITGESLPSAASDQYSLGSIAYELFAGYKPFSALLKPFVQPGTEEPHQPSVIDLFYRYISEVPPSPRNFNPALPIFREQAILKAMAKKPKDRYPDISDFITALFPTSH